MDLLHKNDCQKFKIQNPVTISFILYIYII